MSTTAEGILLFKKLYIVLFHEPSFFINVPNSIQLDYYNWALKQD